MKHATAFDRAVITHRLAAPRGRAEHNRGRPITAAALPGRNAPCPCGSGKKHKRCHGKGAA